MKMFDRFLAFGAATATVVLATVAVVLSVLGDNLGVSDVGWLAGQTAFALVGSVLLFRQPRNVVGRILGASGVLALTQAVVWRYADLAVSGERSLPFAVAAAWLGGWVFIPMFALFLVALPLYFPTGRLLSRRWRPVAWTAAVLAVLVSFYQATAPGPMEDLPVDNPMTLAVSARIAVVFEGIGGDDTMMVGFLVLGMLAWGSVVVRYRRASGVERLQLKWFMWAVGSFLAYMLISTVLTQVLLQGASSTVNDLVSLVFMLGVPVSIGIAVLRYRLYDINRIVSRTVSYGLLTVLLGGIYLAAVTSLTAVTAPVTRNSPIAVAAATLLAAAAFGPARRRIQAGVDRRFNRSRYDAQQMVQRFAARMRDEIDLDQLSTELHSVSAQALEPSRSALWLREASP